MVLPDSCRYEGAPPGDDSGFVGCRRGCAPLLDLPSSCNRNTGSFMHGTPFLDADPQADIMPCALHAQMYDTLPHDAGLTAH